MEVQRQSAVLMTHNLIISIPHTGTRFLRDQLGIDRFIHTARSWDFIMKEIEGKKLIAPLRSPKACWKSATRRQQKGRIFDIAKWVRSWYIMHALTLIRDIEFVIIERRTDPRVENWAKVGQNDPGDNKSVPAIDLKPIYALPFVRPHYSISDPR